MKNLIMLISILLFSSTFAHAKPKKSRKVAEAHKTNKIEKLKDPNRNIGDPKGATKIIQSTWDGMRGKGNTKKYISKTPQHVQSLTDPNPKKTSSSEDSSSTNGRDADQ